MERFKFSVRYVRFGLREHAMAECGRAPMPLFASGQKATPIFRRVLPAPRRWRNQRADQYTTGRDEKEYKEQPTDDNQGPSLSATLCTRRADLRVSSIRSAGEASHGSAALLGAVPSAIPNRCRSCETTRSNHPRNP